VDIPLPVRAGHSENHTSGLLNKSSSTAQLAELSSRAAPLPSLSLLIPSSKPPAAKQKDSRSSDVERWCWLASVGEFGV